MKKLSKKYISCLLGFTLVELLVVIAIIGVLITAYYFRRFKLRVKLQEE
jgi:prepilin-type N-terminal cleavage/methylation domain-containing protein